MTYHFLWLALQLHTADYWMNGVLLSILASNPPTFVLWLGAVNVQSPQLEAMGLWLFLCRTGNTNGWENHLLAYIYKGRRKSCLLGKMPSTFKCDANDLSIDVDRWIENRTDVWCFEKEWNVNTFNHILNKIPKPKVTVIRLSHRSKTMISVSNLEFRDVSRIYEEWFRIESGPGGGFQIIVKPIYSKFLMKPSNQTRSINCGYENRFVNTIICRIVPR